MKAILVAVLLGVGLAAASKCTDERDAAHQSGLLGAHGPECDADGRYHHTQCQESVCSCVDQQTGTFIPGESVNVARRSEMEARCGSKCEQERAKAMTSGLMGATVPQCDNQGKYHSTQCHESFCACADQNTGKVVSDTSGPISDIKNINARCSSACEQQRATILASGLIGAHAPECDNTQFHSVQCHESVCFCVDQQSGEVRKGTEAPVSEKAELEKTCSKKSKCQSEREAIEAGSALHGTYKPRCESNGLYHHTQCFGSVCFCVDITTGEKRADTEMSIADIRKLALVCDSPFINLADSPKGCADERDAARKSGLLGAHAPDCDADGKYHHTQCQEAVCFCVDPKTGDKREGSETPIAQKSELETTCAQMAKCQSERDAVEAGSARGGYKPRCESNGLYHHTQCFGSVCFCVDITTGEKRADTEMSIADIRKLALVCDSPFIKMAGKPRGCKEERAAAIKSGLLGAFKPVCEENGMYYPMQCQESVCYCVDRITGGKLAGTEGHISTKSAVEEQCQASNGFMALAATPKGCNKEREAASKSGLLGAFKPECDNNGMYHPMQCHESVCYCVDRLTGGKLAGTEGHISTKDQIDAKCQRSNSFISMVSEPQDCQTQRSAASGLLGAFKPECSSNGRFQPGQCHERTCFCVDPFTGEKQDGSEKEGVGIDTMIKKCVQRMTPCEKDRHGALSGMGAFVPTCTSNGAYEKKQCHGSVCFCVDTLEGRKVEGSETEGRQDPHCDRTQCQRQQVLGAGIGTFRPKCNPTTFNFEAVQCREAECFCVDRVTGKQVGDSVSVGQHAQLQDKCSTECEKARDSVLGGTNFMGGRHAPTCTDNGDFYKVQCQEAVCECVNANGKARPGTQKNIGQYRQLERQCPGAKQCSASKSVSDVTSCPDECTPITLYGRSSVYCCCA